MNTDNLQISPILFEALSNNPLILVHGDKPEYKLDRILQFDKAVQHILELGIEEHSGDWDPFYVINTKTNKFETEQGSSQIISHTNDTITFLNYDEDGNEIELVISIKDIISINLQR